MSKEKCAFSKLKLTFMGYLLSNQAIGPTESHVEAVIGVREVRSFLALVNFRERFTPPLQALLSHFTG